VIRNRARIRGAFLAELRKVLFVIGRAPPGALSIRMHSINGKTLILLVSVEVAELFILRFEETAALGEL
jgi:hypothetical protein